LPLLLQTLGEAMIGAGQREGLDVLRRARAMAVQSGGPREAWRTGAALGDALARTGSWSEALTVWREAARAESRLRAVPLGHRLDSTRLRAVRPVFDRAIRVAAHLGDADAAFELIELVKARGLQRHAERARRTDRRGGRS
jgi:hypothetical protein